MSEPGRGEMILASASASRRRLLEAAGLSFRVVPADVDEAALKRELAKQVPAASAAAIAQDLARAKARAVSALFPDACVVGADQVLEFDNTLFDKPADIAAARAHLMRLRGKTHRVLTAVSVVLGGEVVWQHLQTATMTMRAFSPEFLDWYLAKAGIDVVRSVGAFEIEGPGIQLFDRIEGDYFAILGLPLLPLLDELRSRGVIGA
jgi:nucleoside triphosphate pyrophosphatase